MDLTFLTSEKRTTFQYIFNFQEEDNLDKMASPKVSSFGISRVFVATDRGLVGSVQAFSYIDSSERWSRLSFVQRPLHNKFVCTGFGVIRWLYFMQGSGLESFLFSFLGIYC